MTAILLVATVIGFCIALGLAISMALERAREKAQAMAELDRALSDLKALGNRFDEMAEQVRNARIQ